VSFPAGEWGIPAPNGSWSSCGRCTNADCVVVSLPACDGEIPAPNGLWSCCGRCTNVDCELVSLACSHFRHIPKNSTSTLESIHESITPMIRVRGSLQTHIQSKTILSKKSLHQLSQQQFKPEEKKKKTGTQSKY
jgi:hypothetical protein